MFHTPAHKVAPHLPQAGTIEHLPYADDPRVIVNERDDVLIGNVVDGMRDDGLKVA